MGVQKCEARFARCLHIYTLDTSCSQAHDLQEHLIIQLRQIGAFNLA